MTAKAPVVIVGVGSLLGGDDAVGSRAVARRAETGKLPPEVRVLDAGTIGLELLAWLELRSVEAIAGSRISFSPSAVATRIRSGRRSARQPAYGGGSAPPSCVAVRQAGAEWPADVPFAIRGTPRLR